MQGKTLLKTIIVLAAIGIIVLVGVLWFKDHQKMATEDKYAGFTTYVDRDLTDERLAELELKEQTLTASLESDPDDLENWRSLAMTRYQLGDLVGAAEAYEKALEINSINYPSWVNLGDVRKHMGDYQGAEEAYRKAIELQPTNETYYFKLIDLWQQYVPARDADVEEMLVFVIQNLGQSRESLVRLADWYMAHENYEEAVSHYEVASDLDPDSEAIQKDLAEAKEKLREQRTSGND